jgi:hypothetical protein
MSNGLSHPDLVKVTELFLVPSSFLVAALGTADTNLHRGAVSILGLVAASLWMVAVHDAYRDMLSHGQAAGGVPIRTRMLYWLPITFGFGWIVSAVFHFAIWNKPLGTF